MTPRHFTNPISRVLPTLMIVLGCAAQVHGQTESSLAGVEESEILKQIERLAAPERAVKQDAVNQLLMTGEPGLKLLQSRSAGVSPAHRELLQSLIRELVRTCFVERLKRLEENRTAESAAGIPEWSRFEQLVGSSPEDISRFIRLVKSERQLFATSAFQPRQLTAQLESRAGAVLQSTEKAPVMIEEFSLDSFAALLLLAGNKDVRLRAASASISPVLLHKEFLEAATKKGGEWYLRLAGSYILRGRISMEYPLAFASKTKLPEGITLARDVLKNSLRASHGEPAMLLLLENGAVEDIALLESLFDNRGRLFVSRIRTYTVYNGDFALATAIVMRGKDPRDFGFRSMDPRTVPFRVTVESAGFYSEADRIAAREAYRDKFGK